jgi:hypothetical protein
VIETYQEQQALERVEPIDAAFATVGAVYADGVSLIFDGATEPSQKHYKVNAFVVFKAGDRVRIIKDSGTYVVEYPVGNPKSSFAADTAASADKLSTAQKISLAGVLSGYIMFDGSADKSIIASFASTAIAPAAGSVDNLYTSYGNIYFRGNTNGKLEVKIGSSGTWFTLQSV